MSRDGEIVDGGLIVVSSFYSVPTKETNLQKKNDIPGSTDHPPCWLNVDLVPTAFPKLVTPQK
jgi:hypothetical protein